jgi:MOSC domain-containing protein YiiM
MSNSARVISTCLHGDHEFSKQVVSEIALTAGRGVIGDVHFGETVKHRSRVARDPSQPNLRQVHLMQVELHKELKAMGYTVAAGNLGENILSENIDLLGLPINSILNIGAEVSLQLTGLRNPCLQLDNFQQGLTKAVLDRDEDGNLVRKAGVMAVVLQGGIVAAGDEINVEYPPEPHQPLIPV